MAVYVDSSVVLRVILGEPDPLETWARIDQPVSSELIRVECLRTIDRARIVLGLSDPAVAERRSAVIETVDTFSLVPMTRWILERAAEPFPTSLGSLDALHLASALLARRELGDLVIATHDLEFGLAARAMGFEVVGVAA